MITFVQMPIVDYNWMTQRPQQIMLELSKRKHEVYYINTDFNDYISKVNENLYLVGRNTDMNNIKMRHPVVLWCSSPNQVININRIPHDFVLYDVIDECSHEFIKWKLYVDDMINKSDIIFTASTALYNKFKLRCSKAYLISNGVDLNNYSMDKKNWPIDLPKVRNIVGYIGAIASWLDYEIINYITKYVDNNYVFIGPFMMGFKPMNISSNLFYLGYKQIKELPFYINNFNSCIIPFKVNSMTNGCNPIKFYEYSSLGKPVVTSNIDEMKKYGELCYISKSKEEFLLNINKSLDETSINITKKRVELAEKNSWSMKIDEILKILYKEFKIE